MMPDETKEIPYREGEPPPGPGYILVQMVDTIGSDDGLRWVLPNDLRNGPIRHRDVEPLLPMLRWVWRHLGGHVSWCRSFEDWELGFMRDSHPGPEVTMWTRQTYAYLEYTHKHPNADKAAVFGAITCLMNGREDQIDPASVARTLKRLLENAPSILQGAENFTKDGRLRTKEKHLR
jgi:hypothetical protein